MGFQEIDTTSFPQRVMRGGPSVTIRENGQLGFSASLADVLNKESKLVFVRVDTDARIVQLQGVAAAPKGKEKSCLKIAWPAKGTGCTISFSGVLKTRFADYDYKGSSNQTLSGDVVKSNAEKHVVQFVVPVGKLTPKAKVVRTRKAKKGEAATATVAAAAPAVAADVVDDDISV